MERRRFGTTNREVSALGQGTWYDESNDNAAAIAALRLGLELGMTHIDTAEMYGSGAVPATTLEIVCTPLLATGSRAGLQARGE